jgi:hypothetical protein
LIRYVVAAIRVGLLRQCRAREDRQHHQPLQASRPDGRQVYAVGRDERPFETAEQDDRSASTASVEALQFDLRFNVTEPY